MDEVRQVVVHPAAWLLSRGIVLGCMDSGDDLPTYVMQPLSLEAGGT